MSSTNIYYVYAYLRENGSPYYIGKGTKTRAWHHNSRDAIMPPKDQTRIVIIETGLTNIGALALERRLIRWYGRLDLQTGILRNTTDGGDGSAGYRHTEEHRQKLKAAYAGKQIGDSEESKEKRRISLSIANKGKPKSEEFKANLRGKTLSDETKAKMKGRTPWNKGKTGIVYSPEPTYQCPHCGKSMKRSLLNRWHGDNCKVLLNPQNH